MDKESCRYYLRAWRPNGADRDDPTLAEAVAQARDDPELSAWFAREQAIDRAIADRVRTVRAPADLRRQIMDGVAASRRPGFTLSWRLALAGLAAAASIALGIYTVFPKRGTPTIPFETIVASAVAFTGEAPAPAHISNSLQDLRRWFASESVPVPGEMPSAMGALIVVGGNALVWEGVPASHVSFLAPTLTPNPEGAATGATAQFFTVDRRSCSGAGVGRTPQVFAQADLTVATWRDAGHIYVLVANVPEETLRAFLMTPPAVALAMNAHPEGQRHAFRGTKPTT